MRTGRRSLILGLSILFIAPLAHAQDAPAPPGSAALDAWVGTWTAEGTMMDMNLSGSVTWQWALGGWYLHGTQAVTMSTPEGDLPVEAAGILKPNGDGTYTGHWYESTGMDWDMTGRDTDAGVVLSWTSPMGTFQMTVVSGEGTGTGTIQRQGDDGAWADAGSINYTAATTD